MQDLDGALARLEAAVDALERSLAEAASPGPDPALVAERDRLAAEVADLRESAKRDEELRAEAAEAVKAALGDLRAIMPEDRLNG